MMLAVNLVVGVLMCLGLLGTLLPAVPGAALILAGALLHAVFTEFDPVGPWHLLLLAGLTGLAYLVDYGAGALGAQRFGGSGWAVLGALVGAVVGLFFGIIGLIVGPILGAVAAEWLRSRDAETSVRSGVGTALGLLVGIAVKFGTAVAMIALFLFWVLRG